MLARRPSVKGVDVALPSDKIRQRPRHAGRRSAREGWAVANFSCTGRSLHVFDAKMASGYGLEVSAA